MADSQKHSEVVGGAPLTLGAARTRIAQVQDVLAKGKDAVFSKYFSDVPNAANQCKNFVQAVDLFVDSMLAKQPKILETQEEFYVLESLAACNRAKVVNAVLRKRADQCVLSWMRTLGTGGGRPRKQDVRSSEKYALAVEVHKVLPDLMPWIARKKQILKAKGIKTGKGTDYEAVLTLKLRDESCPEKFLGPVIRSGNAVDAACRYLRDQGPYPSPETMARYYREYRKLFNEAPKLLDAMQKKAAEPTASNVLEEQLNDLRPPAVA